MPEIISSERIRFISDINNPSENKLAKNIKERAIEYQKKTMNVLNFLTTSRIFRNQLNTLLKPLGFTVTEKVSTCAQLSSFVLASPSSELTQFITELLSVLSITGNAFIFMKREGEKDGHIICMAERKIKTAQGETSKISFFDSTDGEITFFYTDKKKKENVADIFRWLTDYLTYYGNPHEVIANPDNKNAEKRGDRYYEMLKPYESIKVFYGAYLNPHKLSFTEMSDEKTHSSPISFSM